MVVVAWRAAVHCWTGKRSLGTFSYQASGRRADGSLGRPDSTSKFARFPPESGSEPAQRNGVFLRGPSRILSIGGWHATMC